MEKEVYHKDILKGKGFYWIIEWQNRRSQIHCLAMWQNTKNWLFMDEVDRMEVVGNVFETPRTNGVTVWVAYNVLGLVTSKYRYFITKA